MFLFITLDTTPQAPLNVQFEQISSNILVSWEPGYDGGRKQHFMIWYRMIHTRKRNWNLIRVLPNNATEFVLLNLILRRTYEITIVGENDIGLGLFSPIKSIYLNDNQDLHVGHFHYLNETDFLRPLSPVNLHLLHSSSNLFITWNHPIFSQSLVNIIYYVIRWRSAIVFNNQQSQQFIVVQHPIRSYTLKNIKPSKYVVQIVSYSDQGIYSLPVESEINISMYHFCSMLIMIIINNL